MPNSIDSKVSPRAFVPFNDAPRYLVAKIGRDRTDQVTISGRAKYHLEGWYNVGGRTSVLEAHSFIFSVEAIPVKNLGAYSVGILGASGVPRINLSHFLRSSVSLGRVECVRPFYSGFGFDEHGDRFQHGLPTPSEVVDNRHRLSVEYDHEYGLLSCSANGSLVEEIRGRLEGFSLELRLEAVGVEGEFEVVFDNLRYSSLDNRGNRNISLLQSPEPFLLRAAETHRTQQQDIEGPIVSSGPLSTELMNSAAPAAHRSPRKEPIRLEAFLSYSHRDEKLREKLDRHLSGLRRQGLIQVWNDRQIGAGAEFDYEISSHLESANLVLLLISADFIASDYCWSQEMTRAMARHAAGDTRVIPIILRPCDWHDAPFGKLVALPTDGSPVTSSRWPNTDFAFQNIAAGVRKAVNDLLAKVEASGR